jgi:two-component system sensor histidine kinase/response regulator
MRVIDADLDKTAVEFRSAVEDAKRESPSLAPAIEAAAAQFDQAISASRPVRAATLIQDNDKAMKLMRESVDPDMAKARQSFVGLAEELKKRVDQQSDELTSRTNRTILVTRIVIVIGLTTSFFIALSIVQVEVVKVVLSFRSRILDVQQRFGTRSYLSGSIEAYDAEYRTSPHRKRERQS